MLSQPDWLTPGRSRLLFGSGGTFSMATMILSGHYDPAYPPATKFIVENDRPGPLVRWTRRLNCNWLIAVAGHGFPPEDEADQEQWLAEVVAEGHRHGIAVLPYLSLTNIYRDRFERLHPEVAEWYARDVQGQEVPYAAGKYVPGRRPPRLMACLSSPGWWEYLAAKMDRAADTGVDGLYYDNIFSTCFCSRCQAAYAAFAEQRLGRPLAFQQMRTFDKGSYMGGGIEVVAQQAQASDEALLEQEFRMNQIVGVLRGLKQRFLERAGKSIMVCNAHNRPLLNDVCELILTEDGIEAGVLPAAAFPAFQSRSRGFPGLGETLPAGQDYRLATNAGLYKYMAADGGYDKPWSNFQHPVRYRGEPGEPMAPRSWQQSIAEAQAFSGDYLLVNTHFFLPALEQPEILRAVERIHRFVAEQRSLWDARYPLADTLVPAWDITTVERALGELALENYPFEVAPALQVDEARLARYKTLLLLEEAGARRLDPEALVRFVERGGHIVLAGLPDHLLPEAVRARANQLPDLSAERLVENLGDEASRRLKRELICLNGTPCWEVAARRGVLGNLAANADGSRWVLHLLNLWDEPAQWIRVTLHGLPGSDPAVTVYSLNGRPRVRRLAVAPVAGGLTFTLPQLDLYAAVEVASSQSGA